MATPIRELTDDLVVGTVGTDLRAAGFRKSGRTWWRDDAGVRRAVTYRGHWSNTSTSGTLVVGIGASYERLGHDQSVKPIWDSGGLCFTLQSLRPDVEERWTWDRISDATDDDEVRERRAAFEADWGQFGLPLTLAAAAPESLGAHIAEGGNTGTVRVAVEMIARPLDDHDLMRSLAQRGLVAARARPRWRSIANDPRPLEAGLTYWEWLLRLADETGVAPSDDDLAAARATLDQAATGRLQSAYHSGPEEAAARYLADRLGADLPTFAPMKFNARS